jgi:glycosyltransferase involved in cell wall biosynthesis
VRFLHSVLVLSFTNLKTDPRVSRQLRWLAESYRVTAVGLVDPQIPGVQFVEAKPYHGSSVGAKVLRGLRFLFRRFERVYWNMAAQVLAQLLQDQPHDLVIANDPDTLPLAIALAKRWQARVVFDAHEYAPREFEENWKWRILHGPYASYLCGRYMPQADATITVCEGIAEAYWQLIGKKPVVVTNAPDYHPELAPVPYDAAKPIRIIHHGGAMWTRKIEVMVDMAKLLDERFEVSFMLVGDEGYRKWLQDRAANHPRIRFLPSVPMPELPKFLNQFDLGLYLFTPTNFNNHHSLPNKFFEFLQARLGVAIGPSPEMARIVRESGAGIVAEDFKPATLAKLLNQLTADEINRFKEAAHRGAEKYSANTNRKLFMDVVYSALGLRS